MLSAVESRSAITVGKMAHSIQLLLPDALILSGFGACQEKMPRAQCAKLKSLLAASFTPISTKRYVASVP